MIPRLWCLLSLSCPFHSWELKKSSYHRKYKVVRIGSVIIFHLSKLWKAKFSILCDVLFLVRLQGKFDIALLGVKWGERDHRLDSPVETSSYRISPLLNGHLVRLHSGAISHEDLPWVPLKLDNIQYSPMARHKRPWDWVAIWCIKVRPTSIYEKALSSPGRPPLSSGAGDERAWERGCLSNGVALQVAGKIARCNRVALPVRSLRCPPRLIGTSLAILDSPASPSPLDHCFALAPIRARSNLETSSNTRIYRSLANLTCMVGLGCQPHLG